MPAIPSGIATVVLTGRYIRPDGTPLTGTLTFEPPSHLTIPGADTISAGSASVTLDESGSFSATLIATDQAGMQPSDWTYTLIERLHHATGRTFAIKLPGSAPLVDLADIAPTDPNQGDYVIVTGPAGKDGSQIYVGTGTPSAALGANGDFYVDTTTNAVTLYGPRTSTSWPSTGTVLTSSLITAVNGKTGNVTLTAADVGAITQTSGDARYAMLATSAREGIGIYVPPGWGATWKTKLAAAQAGTGTAVLATVGGSSTQGYYASNLRTKGWVDLLRTSLQATYGDGGSGYRGAGLTGIVQAADGVPAAATTAYNANGNNATLSGSWSVGGSSYGPGAKYVFTSTIGDSYTMSVRGTQVDIYIVAGSTAPHTTFSYQIDGGTVVTVPTTGTADNIQKTTITGLASGIHTVVIKHAGTAGQYVAICGVAGSSGSGAIVNNFGRYGSRSANFSATDETTNTSWNGSYNYPADLVILTHGPNDAANGDSGDTWVKNQRIIMDRIRNSGGAIGAADLMIMLPHIGTYDSATTLYQDYAARARGLAEAYGAAFVNMWTIGRNSWNYWSSLGYWSNSSNPGVAGTDNVHPSDAGHQFIANTVLPLIV